MNHLLPLIPGRPPGPHDPKSLTGRYLTRLEELLAQALQWVLETKDIPTEQIRSTLISQDLLPPSFPAPPRAEPSVLEDMEVGNWGQAHGYICTPIQIGRASDPYKGQGWEWKTPPPEPKSLGNAAGSWEDAPVLSPRARATIIADRDLRRAQQQSIPEEQPGALKEIQRQAQVRSRAQGRPQVICRLNRAFIHVSQSTWQSGIFPREHELIEIIPHASPHSNPQTLP